MARPRIPTAVLEAQGKLAPGAPNAARFREQHRENEPEPLAPIRAEAPEHMTPAQKELWKKVLAMVPPGVLGCSDEITVQLVVVLWSRLNEGTIVSTEISHLRNLLVQLGMTPASRSKVVGSGGSGPAKESDNPEDEFV